MIEKLPILSVALAALCSALYMFYERDFELTPEALGLFIILALLFSAVELLIRKRRS